MRLDNCSQAMLFASIEAAMGAQGRGRGGEVNDIQVAISAVLDGGPADDEAQYLAACLLWLYGCSAKKP